MNILTMAERDRFFETFKKEMKGKELGNSSVVLCPPAVHVESFVKKLKSEKVSIGGQDAFWEERGSYTGEISSPMLKNLGAEYVIIGHSERRRYFSEINDTANSKVKMALKNGLKVIYCVGETSEQRQAGNTPEVIIEQVMQGLLEVPATKINSVTVAYEPVWAVGSDVIPTSNEILEVKVLIRKILADMYGLAAAEKIRILYGGSVKAATAEQVCLDPGMDGVLVGRESLVPQEFLKVAEIIDKN